MNWSEAKKSGSRRYRGKLCDKHPELNGERVTSSGRCLGCSKERVLASRRVGGPSHESWKEYHKKHNVERHRKGGSGHEYKMAHNKIRKLRQRCVGSEGKKDIIDFYSNRPDGYHVDHIIPLNGELVSGLHVLQNLQYLPAVDNIRKGNKTETE